MQQPSSQQKAEELLRAFEELSFPDTAPAWQERLLQRAMQVPASQPSRQWNWKIAVPFLLIVLLNGLLWLGYFLPEQKSGEQREEILQQVENELLIRSTGIK